MSTKQTFVRAHQHAFNKSMVEFVQGMDNSKGKQLTLVVNGFVYARFQVKVFHVSMDAVRNLAGKLIRDGLQVEIK